MDTYFIQVIVPILTFILGLYSSFFLERLKRRAGYREATLNKLEELVDHLFKIPRLFNSEKDIDTILFHAVRGVTLHQKFIEMGKAITKKKEFPETLIAFKMSYRRWMDYMIEVRENPKMWGKRDNNRFQEIIFDFDDCAAEVYQAIYKERKRFF